MTGGRRCLRLAGRLERAQTADVERLCGADGVAMCLDLTDLLSADDAGLATLEALRRRGVELVSVSPYLILQLEVARARGDATLREPVARQPTAPDRRNNKGESREDE